MLEIKTKSPTETQKTAALLVKKILKMQPRSSALVLALEGNLGSGKTTFVQGLARALGVKENVLSPTFVLMKIYQISPKHAPHRTIGSGAGPKAQNPKLRHLIHIDCYRLNSPKDLLHLGLKNLLKDRDAIIPIEWANHVRKLIPKSALWIKFKHGRNLHERILKTNLHE